MIVHCISLLLPIYDNIWFSSLCLFSQGKVKLFSEVAEQKKKSTVYINWFVLMSSNKPIHTHKFRIKPLKVHREGIGLQKLPCCPIILSTVAEMDIVVPPNRVLCQRPATYAQLISQFCNIYVIADACSIIQVSKSQKVDSFHLDVALG